MATNPLLDARQKWAARKQWAVSQGMSSQMVDTLAHADLQRVEQGSAAMSREEAGQAMWAAHHQQLSTPPPETKHRGIGGIIGNIAPDIGHIIGGLATAATHPGQTIKAIEHDPTMLIPGLSTAKAVLHGDWKQLEEHPVGTFLDVAAVAAPIAKLARLGGLGEDVAAAGEKLGLVSEVKAGRLGKALGMGEAKQFVTGSAEEAFAKGQMAKGTLRAAARGINKISQGRLTPGAKVADVVSAYQLLGRQSEWAGKVADAALGHFNTVDDTAALLERAHGAEWFTRHADPERLAGAEAAGFEKQFTPKLSDVQARVEDVIRQFGTKPHVIDTLNDVPDLQKEVVNLFRDQGNMKTFGALVQAGMVIPTTAHADMLAELPKNLQDLADRKFTILDPKVEGQSAKFLRDALDKHFPEWDKQAGFHGFKIHQDMHDLFFGKHGIFAARDWEIGGPAAKYLKGAVKLEKKSLFLRPSMAVHMALGQLVFMSGQGVGVFAPSNIVKAFHAARTGSFEALAGGSELMTTDFAHGVAAGNHVGAMLRKVPQSMTRVSNAITGMERAMTYFAEHGRQLRAGATEAAANEAGLAMIRDTFHTLNDMTPFESMVVKQITPFYGFHKHAIQFLAKYPAEHPIRAEILSQIGERESKDMANGLPQQFASLFSLGTPDAKGNVKTLDAGIINPFKSVARDLGGSGFLAGFTANLNPAGQVLLRAMGIDPTKGSPQAFGATEYDPETGRLKTVEPGLKGAGGIQGVAQMLVPQLGGLAAIPGVSNIADAIGFNNRLKSMKLSDPSAYRQMLFSQLGIPIPRTLNVYEQMAKAEGAAYKAAQQDVSAAVKTGDFSHVAGYLRVPFRGQLVTPRQLEAWYAAQLQRIGGHLPAGVTSLKALIGR